MRNYDAREFQRGNGRGDFALETGVQVAGRLVEEQDGRPLIERSGERMRCLCRPDIRGRLFSFAKENSIC